MRECGELVLRSQLESMVEVLDQHFFLEGPRVEAERARQRAAFLGGADPPRVPGRALLRGGARSLSPTTLAGILRAPGGPGTDRTAARHRHRAASWRRTSTSTGAAQGTRGRTAPWPRRSDADCFIVLGTAHAGLDGHALRGDRQGLRDALRSARGRPRGPGRDRPTGAGGSLRRRARPPGRALHRVPGGLAPVPAPPDGWGRAADRAAPRRASLTSAWRAAGARPAQPDDRARCSTRAGRHGHRAAALLRRGRRGPRARGPAVRRRVARGPAELARVQSEDRALLAPVAAGDAEGFFAEALRQRDRNRICGLSPIYSLLRLLPGGAGHAPPLRAVAGSRRARSPSPAWPSRTRAAAMTSCLRPGPARPRTRASPAPSGSTARAPGAHEGWRSLTRASCGTSTRTSGPTATGHYLQAGPFRVPVQVDDAPFVVVRAQARTIRARSTST